VKREDYVETQIVADSARTEPDEQTERREHARIAVSIDVEIVDSKTGARISGRATDFGVGGCYVDTLNTLPQGTPVEVLLNWQGHTLQMRALVSYAAQERSIGMGLAFIGVSNESGVSLLDWMAGLSHETPRRVPSPKAESATDPRKALRELLALLLHKEVLSQSEVTQLFRLLEAASTAEPGR
jgi:hypothetical protein